MVNYKDFECILTVPDIRLDDIASARRALLDVVNDPSFETMVRNLEVAATRAKAGPAPRGTEVEVSCKADKEGRVSCEGSVRISF